jgi:pSer/pThr/pTyr-binding forkhead associated (FHA) protein
MQGCHVVFRCSGGGQARAIFAKRLARTACYQSWARVANPQRCPGLQAKSQPRYHQVPFTNRCKRQQPRPELRWLVSVCCDLPGIGLRFPRHMQSCPRCGGINTESGAFCQHCGHRFSDDRSTAVARLACPSCGASNPVGTTFCHDCGVRLDSRTPVASMDAGGPLPSETAALRPLSARPAEPASFQDRSQDSLQGVASIAGGARLINVRRDGSDGTSHTIDSDQYDLGRSEGDLLFDDPHMASRHARIVHRDGQFVVFPLETRNGVYVRLRQPVELYDGDHFLLGKQVLRFEVPFEVEKTVRPAIEHGVVFFGTPVKPAWGRLRQLTAGGTTRDMYHLTRAEMVLGREQGDIVFGDDEFLSRRHAQLHVRNNRVTLTDLGSSNGTFVRLRGQHLLASGELLRIGDELLRFEIG